jgi:SAM-dependent methyltransferase
MLLQSAYDLVEEDFNQQLDEPLDPSGPDSLFGYVAEMGFPAGAVAVDAGCGEGEHAIELAGRFGFQVTGVDLVTRCVETARLNVPRDCPVTFTVGSVQNLPLPSGSVDLVWSRDALSLVEDQGAVYREFRRVLKPGGRALIYQMFTTSMLQASEAAFLLPALGCSAAAMHPENAEAAMRDAGLRIDRCAVLGSEWGEYYQEHVPDPRSHLLHAARLLRDPDRYIARFGKENYDIKLADCLWHVYRMIGKLSSRVYVLSAPAQLTALTATTTTVIEDATRALVPAGANGTLVARRWFASSPSVDGEPVPPPPPVAERPMDAKSGLRQQRGEIGLAVQREPAFAVRAVVGCNLETLALAFGDTQK